MLRKINQATVREYAIAQWKAGVSAKDAGKNAVAGALAGGASDEDSCRVGRAVAKAWRDHDRLVMEWHAGGAQATGDAQ